MRNNAPSAPKPLKVGDKVIVMIRSDNSYAPYIPPSARNTWLDAEVIYTDSKTGTVLSLTYQLRQVKTIAWLKGPYAEQTQLVIVRKVTQ